MSRAARRASRAVVTVDRSATIRRTDPPLERLHLARSATHPNPFACGHCFECARAGRIDIRGELPGADLELGLRQGEPMELTIEPATEETHRELAGWRYPPPYDFHGAAHQGASVGFSEPRRSAKN